MRRTLPVWGREGGTELDLRNEKHRFLPVAVLYRIPADPLPQPSTLIFIACENGEGHICDGVNPNRAFSPLVRRRKFLTDLVLVNVRRNSGTCNRKLGLRSEGQSAFVAPNFRSKVPAILRTGFWKLPLTGLGGPQVVRPTK